MNTNNEKNAAEKLSAYIDDDLNADEIEALIAEHDSSGRAPRYQMMGDALRGELSDASMVDVSAQVREALLNESFDAVESTPVTKAVKNKFSLVAWLDDFFGAMAKPLAGMAVAASVAVLMVVTVAQVESPEAQQLANTPVNLPVETLVANKLATDPSSDKQQQAAEFDKYLTEHAEFAAQDTLQGRIPYVRAVSYEAE